VREPAPGRALWVNGRIVRGAEATLSLFDRGARDGEGLFETLRVHDGRPHQWTRHLERLVVSAGELGFPVPPPPARLLAGLEELLAAEGLGEAVARITVTRGVPGGRPTRAGAWIDVEPLEGRLWPGTRSGGARLMCSRRPFEPGRLGRHKTTSRLAYSLAREEARAARADEALLVDGSGTVLEGATSNVFVVADGRVVTPPLDGRILPGITRQDVLEACTRERILATEAAIDRPLLARAEEVFVTNAVQGVVPAAVLDGRPLPGRAIGTGLREIWKTELRAG